MDRPDLNPVASTPSARIAEEERLAILARYEILGTPPEVVFDDLARLAAHACGAELAAIGFLAEDGVWVKAWHGLTAEELPGLAALTGRLLDPGVELVEHPDLALTGPPDAGAEVRAIAFVAAVAVRSPEGALLGAVTVADGRAGALTSDQRESLRSIARQCGHVLAMRMRAREYQRFVELAPDGVAILDPGGRLALVNSALVRLLGAGATSDLVGTRALDLVVDEERRLTEAELAPVLRGERRTVRLQTVVDGPSGPTPVVVSASYLGEGASRVKLVVRDISDEVEAQQERDRLAARLQQSQRLETVGQLAGGIAHDFNNIALIITSNLEFAREDLEEVTDVTVGAGKQVLEDLAAARHAAERASALTRQLLMLAQRRSVRPEVVDSHALLDHALRLIRPALPSDIVVEVSSDARGVNLEVDVTRIEQALVNLAVNARDAMPSGGRLRLSTEVLLGRELVETGVEHADPDRLYVRFAVADTGTGMDDETLARAFEPFFTTKPRERGTGLGLVGVQTTVTAAGGHVSIDSRLGEGTTVSLWLPAAAPTAGRSAVPAPPATERDDEELGGSETVLLVEDALAVRDVMERILTTAGYRVLAAGGPGQAMTMWHLHRDHVDVLLTDFAMPRMTGTRLAELLHGDRADLPVVLVSGSAAERGVSEHVTVAVAKPVTRTTLLRAVRTALGRDGSDGTA